MTHFLTVDEYVRAKSLANNIRVENLKKPYYIDSIWFDHFMPSLHKGVDIFSADHIAAWSDHQAKSISEKTQILFNNDGSYKLPIVIYEDSFLRSVDIWSTKNSTNYNKTYCLPLGYTRSSFPHYDIRGHGELESYLTDKFIPLTDAQLSRTQGVIRNLIKNGISKYNNQNLSELSQKTVYKIRSMKKSSYRILILDQAYLDQSVSLSGADKETFRTMLDEALKITNNVSIKVHPEQFSGGRRGYYSIEPSDRQVMISQHRYPTVTLISERINPIALILKYFDEVWTCSSQLGFEALMLGKKVRVFGIPFYAGYGLTDDSYVANNEVIKFRNNYKRSFDEIFYNAYIRYCNYVNPFNPSRAWDIESCVEYLIRKKAECSFS